jgi:protein-S-isoprenylcysteine O-methyltransferase Ste14
VNPLYGKALLFIGLVLTILIRVPHDKKSATTKISKDYQTPREKILLAGVAIGVMLLPLLGMFTPILSFADYEFNALSFAAGSIFLALNVWLFYRSHADLGSNWSKTLEIRDNHQLVTTGVYSKVRHPMYSAIFLYVVAQALLLPNWIAGPAGLIAFSTMYFMRVSFEERMMLERFGDDYALYVQRTKRLIPGVY